jgi:hypothetical protein
VGHYSSAYYINVFCTILLQKAMMGFVPFKIVTLAYQSAEMTGEPPERNR